MRKIETLGNAREIFEYINNGNQEQNESFSQELINIVNKYVTLEKFYGEVKSRHVLKSYRNILNRVISVLVCRIYAIKVDEGGNV